MRLPTYHPFSPWQRRGQGQSKSQTPKVYCQRGCLPASTSELVCRAVNGCIKHKTVHITQYSLPAPEFSTFTHQSTWRLTKSSQALCRGTSLPGCDRTVLESSQCFHIWNKTRWEQVKTIQMNIFRKLEVFFTNHSLLLFLLDVFVLGIFCLIFECRAVIYQLLNDFLWITFINILSNNLF